MNKKFYRAVLSVVRPLVNIFYPFEVRGVENMENADKNYIICCNHLSNVDPAFLMLTHKKPIHFMAKSELFSNKLLAWFCGNMGAFAVKRGKGDKSALKNSEKIVNNGETLGIFIEGTRSKTGEFLRPKSGATLIAVGTSADILPVCITGAGKNNRVKMFHKTIVSYGKIIKVDELGYEENSRVSLKNVTNKIMDSIVELRYKEGSSL